jgi:hypothetical protein
VIRLLALMAPLVVLTAAVPTSVASAADPRLERLHEAYALLAPLPDRDGVAYADVLEARRVAIVIDELPPDLLAAYFEPRRRVIVAPATLDEQQPTMVASLIAHELQHAADRDLIREGGAQLDCLEREARGFETQLRIWRTFWPGDLPSGTQAERDLAALAPAYDQRGLDGIRDVLAKAPGYLERCGDVDAPPPSSFQEAP